MSETNASSCIRSELCQRIVDGTTHTIGVLQAKLDETTASLDRIGEQVTDSADITDLLQPVDPDKRTNPTKADLLLTGSVVLREDATNLRQLITDTQTDFGTAKAEYAYLGPICTDCPLNTLNFTDQDA